MQLRKNTKLSPLRLNSMSTISGKIQTYVQKIVSALENMGVEFKLSTEIGTAIKIEELEKEHDKVFFATGAWKRPVLGFDGEQFTEFGLQFLIEVNKWMNTKTRKTVLVSGGGNVAMDVAITAKRLGAETVILACLESEPEMPASTEEIARARAEGVKIMPSLGISKALYKDGKVTGMELVRCTSVYDEKHRFAPVYDQYDKVVIEADSILMAVGQKIDLSFLGEKYELAQERGLIDVEADTQKTSRSGIYAGGDITTGPSTVISAVRSGRVAAYSMNKALGFNGKAKQSAAEGGFLTFSPSGIKKEKAIKLAELPIPERNLELEDTFSPSWEAARAEAERCLNCSCYSVNASDISPVLVALDADIITTGKTIKAENFFTTKLKATDMLDEGELVTEIKVPIFKGYKMAYDKFRIREGLDFAIVSMASAYAMKDGKIKDVKIAFGGVAPVPVKATEVEEFLRDKVPDQATADKAAGIAVKNAICLEHNTYKVNEIKALVTRFVLSMNNFEGEA